MPKLLGLPDGLEGRVWRHAGPSAMRAAHTHADLEMNLVISGKARYLLGNRCYDLGLRSMVWLFPRQPHLLTDWSEDFRMWILVFRPRWVRRFSVGERYRPLRSPSPPGHWCKRLGRRDAGTLDGMLEELGSQEDDPALYNAGLGYCLLRAWDLYQKTEETADYGDLHPGVALAARRMQEDDGAGLSELATAAHLSPSRLSRLFGRQMGVSLAGFRNRLRVRRFLDVYGDGQRMTVLAAAYEAGFGSYAQFYRVFVDVMGVTPQTYRRGQNSE